MTASNMIKNAARNIILATSLAAVVNSACAASNPRLELIPAGPATDQFHYVRISDTGGISGPLDIIVNGTPMSQHYPEFEGSYPIAVSHLLDDLKKGTYEVTVSYYAPSNDPNKQPELITQTQKFEVD